MKILIILTLSLAFLYACDNPQTNQQPKHDSKIWLNVKSTLPGVEVARLGDTFDEYKGQYRVYAMIKNHTKKPLKDLQVNVFYLDANNKELARSVSGPPDAIDPGDSVVVDNFWVFKDRESLPYMVNVTVTK